MIQLNSPVICKPNRPDNQLKENLPSKIDLIFQASVFPPATKFPGHGVQQEERHQVQPFLGDQGLPCKVPWGSQTK